MAANKLIPSVSTGNTCVVKPPELAPVAVLELARILEQAGVPSGVVNVVPGFGGTAGAVVSADITAGPVVLDVDAGAFTDMSSTAVEVLLDAPVAGRA